MNAINAGDVARGGHNAPAADAADDERLVPQGRFIAFFNGCVKGVAVQMRDHQVIELWMAQQPGAAASNTAPFFRQI